MLHLIVGIRVVLGGIFLISALGKLFAPRLFVSNVVQYRILPVPLAKAYGWTLPLLEVGAAILLLSGVWIQWAAAAIAIMLLSFIGAVSIAMARKQNLSCNCFGLLYRERVGWPTLVRDVFMLAMASMILVAGSGAPSIFGLISDMPSPGATIAVITSVLVLAVSIRIAIASVKPSLLSRRTSAHNEL
jgi:uncharacterized membrane protein YphA (DoxX/SURF4 family)